MAHEQFRSFTHPVTNFSHLSGGSAHLLLSGLMQFRLPKNTWPSFVHELTHHWCFNAPVSQALSILYLKPILRLGDAKPPDRYQLGIDLITYEMVMGLLFPFIEGMALFAEFDMVPHRDDDTYSMPLQWTMLLYAFPTPDEDIDTGVVRFLLDQRRSRQMVRRKASVLSQPVRTTREGYLAAYLMIKNVWLTLASRDGRLWESDVFLRFLHWYVFGDFALVARLLEPDDGRRDRFDSVTDAFNAKLSHLVGLGNTELAEIVDEVMKPPRPADNELGGQYFLWDEVSTWCDVWATGPRFGNDPEAWQQGVDHLAREFRELHDHPDDDLRTAVNHGLRWMFTQRESFCVLREQVRVTLSAAGRLVGWHRGYPLLSAPALEGFDLAVGEYDGTLSAYVMTGLAGVFVALAVDGDVGALVVKGLVPTAVKQRLPGYRMNADELTAAFEEGRRMAWARASRDSVVPVIADAIRENLTEWHQRMAEHAAPHLDGAARAAMVERLDQAGLAVIAGSSARVRALASISLLCSFGSSREALAALFDTNRYAHDCDEKFEDVVADIQRRGREQLKDPLIHGTDHLTCVV
jgi:hypothetical protein